MHSLSPLTEQERTEQERTEQERTEQERTEQERFHLEQELKNTRKNVADWKRIFVILNYDEGLSIEELACFMRLSPWTIEEYLKKYSSKKKTKNDPKGGSFSKLTESESSQHLCL